MDKASLLIHPVRIRIVQVFQGKQLSTGEIGQLLPDVPQASLYRHIKLLADGGILVVAGQRQSGAIPEAMYRLAEGSTSLSREEFAAISPEDHLRYYSVFLGHLAGTVGRYFESPDTDTTRDGMTYFAAGLRLTDEQRRQLRLDLLDLARRYMADPLPEGRLTQLGISLAPDLTAENL